MYDELDLDMLGDERTALFLIMSDTDGTFAFLISLIYSILFNRLCERADDVYGGRLPIHVRCLIDEAANIGQIPNLERLMATIRSREISACLVLQAQSQLKALYKDNMDTIIGNCDACAVSSPIWNTAFIKPMAWRSRTNARSMGNVPTVWFPGRTNPACA